MRYTLLLFALLVMACQENKTEYFSHETIAKWCKIDSLDIPSIEQHQERYVKKGDSICETSVRYLLGYYIQHYKSKYSLFEDFVYGVLNGNIQVTEMEECTMAEPTIQLQYEEKGFEVFRDLYWERTDTSGHYRLKLKETGDKNRLYTIFHYCSINGYDIIFDDYSGYYYMLKTQDNQ